LSPISLALIAFACIFGGSLLGMFLRYRLPGHHLDGDTKDVVRLGASLIATIAALVLGLLIASANGTFESRKSQVKQLTANLLLLDSVLTLYGPEADPVRRLLRRNVADLADRIWRENREGSGKSRGFELSAEAVALETELLKLSPQNDTQRYIKTMAFSASAEMGKSRLLLFTNAGDSLPMPFLRVLISWLTIIFVSFSLFADRNATMIVALCIYAASASASLFLILELSQPFSGMMQIASEPLRHALAPLGE
jgi:Protein of unknown function (DUF4239)